MTQVARSFRFHAKVTKVTKATKGLAAHDFFRRSKIKFELVMNDEDNLAPMKSFVAFVSFVPLA